MKRFENIYLPFYYLEAIKRPGKKYLVKTIMGDDLFVLLLCFDWLPKNHLVSGIGLFFILISFWCIYEVGYMENDLVAEKFEEKPIISAAYLSYKPYIQSWQPWLWSLGLAIVGIYLLQKNEIYHVLPKFLDSLGSWIVFLLIMRILFWMYNHLNKQTRSWFYLILQACRYFGFSIVIKTTTTGAFFLVSNIISRLIPYIVYRYKGGKSDSWPQQLPIYFLRFLFYILLLIVIDYGSSESLSLFSEQQTLVIILFCLIRGIVHFQRAILTMQAVWQDGSN